MKLESGVSRDLVRVRGHSRVRVVMTTEVGVSKVRETITSRGTALSVQ